MYIVFTDICLLLTGTASRTEKGWNVHIHDNEIRGSQESSRFSNIDVLYLGFLGFLSRKMTLSVGNQAERCTWESLLFSSWSFNFSFRRCLLAHYIQLKFTSTDVFKFCQYAFIICNTLCVDISWPFHSQDFHEGQEGVKWELGFAFFGGWEMGLGSPLHDPLPYEFFCLPYISQFVSFDNLVSN